MNTTWELNATCLLRCVYNDPQHPKRQLEAQPLHEASAYRSSSGTLAPCKMFEDSSSARGTAPQCGIPQAALLGFSEPRLWVCWVCWPSGPQGLHIGVMGLEDYGLMPQSTALLGGLAKSHKEGCNGAWSGLFPDAKKGS